MYIDWEKPKLNKQLNHYLVTLPRPFYLFFLFIKYNFSLLSVSLFMLSISVFLNINHNFVIMFYSVSTETKQTTLSHF